MQGEITRQDVNATVNTAKNSLLGRVRVDGAIRHAALPAFSTGIYGYALAEATPITLNTVCDFAEKHKRPTVVCFVLFDSRILDDYVRALSLISEQRDDVVLK